MSDSPLVSIIMPVYNGGKFLTSAIDSILTQSYPNLELVIIDDGSQDSSENVIKAFQQADDRVKFISRENRGLVYTLNQLIQMAEGKFIARMDADDIAHPKRIEKQVQHLLNDKSVALVGTGYHYIDENDNKIGSRKIICDDGLLKASLLFGSPFAHPTVMFNVDVCGHILNYDAEYKHAEDYELWLRISWREQLKVVNLADKLLMYRVHSSSVSSVYGDEQLNAAYRALRQFPIIEHYELSGGDIKHLFNSQSGNLFIEYLRLVRANAMHKTLNAKSLGIRILIAFITRTRLSVSKRLRKS
ncbi:glycosyltransferase [Shewanella mesophila]|uniref:glycosyltransferase n=1 Tax=Shewanella mesophila TaxID=2864208 RepID=UPI001C658A98|nr:glycosyltransferase [Shewanella mesophila]QYJ85015.1 glycosyltransferase [Shewanella mesophila]